MEIFCETINVLNEDVPSIPKGSYIYFKTSKKQVMVPAEEFWGLYLKSKTKNKTIGTISEIGVIENIGTAQDTVDMGSKPDFKMLVNYLKEKIEIIEQDFDSTKNELIIKTDIWEILELPWEELIKNDLFVIRKSSNENPEIELKENSLLILISHSYKGFGKNIKEYMDKEVKSVHGIFNYFVEETLTSFKVNNIHLVKHSTTDLIKKIDWNRFNCMHIIMHGDDEGNLLLEDAHDWKQPVKYSAEDLLVLLGEHSMDLVFLSSCYSGGGLSTKESLASKLIRSNKCKNVIAYSGGVGEIYATSFADKFYKNLVSLNSNVKDAYKQAIESCYNENKRDYVPFLYTS